MKVCEFPCILFAYKVRILFLYYMSSKTYIKLGIKCLLHLLC